MFFNDFLGLTSHLKMSLSPHVSESIPISLQKIEVLTFGESTRAPSSKISFGKLDRISWYCLNNCSIFQTDCTLAFREPAKASRPAEPGN